MTTKSDLLAELHQLADRQAGIQVTHYNGRVETGHLKSVEVNETTLSLFLSDHEESTGRGTRRSRVDVDRPIYLSLHLLEFSRDRGQLTLCFAPEEGGEHGFTIVIDTVLAPTA